MAESGPRAQLKVLQNSGSLQKIKPCQLEIATDEIQERKYNRERSSIKARV